MDILVGLEKLAAAFPWDSVSIEVHRKPEGKLRFVVYIPDNRDCGILGSVYISGDKLPEAIDRAIAENSAIRDPRVSRDRAIEELKQQIAKMEAANFEFPPYVPNRELAQFVKPTLDI